MATRRERVVLTLDDDYTPGMAKAAAVTALLNRELNNLSGSSIKADRSSQMFVRDLGNLSREARGAERSINQLTGRLRLFADAAAIFGPGTVPVGGVLAAGVAGFASQLGFAAVAGGVLAGSMQGLGDALGAMNKAQLDPTTKNLEDAHDALKRLSPATRDFATQLFALKPALVAIRDLGAESLIPGLSEAFDSIETLGPRVAGIFQSVAGALGEIAADSAASLASDRWADFFAMIEADAPQALSEMASAIGNVVHGLSEMWEAFAPLNADFSGWLVDVAAGFDSWATGLSATEGFREFVDYIRTTGPQVADTARALGDAIVQIVQASAPLGGPVLAAIEGFAKALGAIADSDLGTPIMVGVSALALYNRTLAATAATQARMAAGGGLFGMMGARQGAVKSSLGAVRKDVEALGATWATAGARTTREQQRMSGSAKSLRGNLAGLAGDSAKALAPLGGIAVASSGVADGFGLTNTATLALMGSIAGPFGVAVGTGAGLLLDMKAAGDSAKQSVENFRASLEGMSLSELNAGLAEAQTLLSAVDGGVNDQAATLVRARIRDIEAQRDKTLELQAAEESRSRRAVMAYASEVGLNSSLATWRNRSVEDIKAMADALAQVREAGTKTAQTFLGFGESLNDSKVSLSQFITDMQKSASALANFNDNSLRAARRGLSEGLVNALRDAGKEGALRMAQLADASESEIERANKAYRSQQRELERTADVTARLAGYSPVELKVKAETGGAMNDIAGLEARLRAIKDEDVFINVRQIGRTTLGPRNEAADGATVPKTGKPYADRHLYLLADGEEVISNRYGQADRHRPLLKAINGGLANGGTAGKKRKRDFEFDGQTLPTPTAHQQAQAANREADRNAREEAARREAEQFAEAERARAEHESKMFLAVIEGQERAARGLIEAAETQKQSAEQVRDGWAQAMDRAGSSATAGFSSNLFGEQRRGLWVNGSGGGTGLSWLDALSGDISGLQQRQGLVSQLSSQGVTGSALEALLAQGDNSQVQELINSGRAGEFAAMYAQREAMLSSTSGMVGRAAYGAQFDASSAAVAAVDAQIQFLTAQLAAISAQRPITVYEAASAQATAAEIARQQSMQGAA